MVRDPHVDAREALQFLLDFRDDLLYDGLAQLLFHQQLLGVLLKYQVRCKQVLHVEPHRPIRQIKVKRQALQQL